MRLTQEEDFYHDYFFRDQASQSNDSKLKAPWPQKPSMWQECDSLGYAERLYLSWKPKEISSTPDVNFLRECGLSFQASNFDWDLVRPHSLVNKCLDPAKPSMTCGRILEHAKQQVTNLREKIGIRLCVFKIGVTTNPVQRYVSYVEKGYQSMWVLNMSNSIDLTHMLEAALISEFGSHVGCRNKRNSGGEGALNRAGVLPPFFVYVTGARADQPRAIG